MATIASVAGPATASFGRMPAAADCTVPDPALEGPPAGLPATAVEPIRSDPDGGKTLLLAVDDPLFGADVYSYTPVANESGTGTEVGVWSHQWPVTRPLTTYGVYAILQGVRFRVPIFLVENGASPDLATAVTVAALREALPLLFNSTPYAVNTAAPGSELVAFAAGLAGFGGIATMYGNTYPINAEYATTPPLYVWTAYRKTTAAEVWAGSVLMHNGAFSSTGTVREGCRRTRMGIATRSGSGTTYVGGVYVLDHVRGSNDGDHFDADETITAGMTAGGIDVPVMSIHQAEHKQGASRGGVGFYQDEQRDEITLAARVGAAFVPLVGTRAEATHADPPNAQRRLVSMGVYDPLGTYHPVVGARAHFERLPADLWPLGWALSGGPGSDQSGDWEADLGTFDPFGEFVPVFGVTYDDAIEHTASTLYRYQMMITAGPWVAGTYHPAVGATYDGEAPLVIWALADANGDYPAMGRWLASAGVLSPLGDYIPLAGAAYRPGVNRPHAVVEEYLVGTFAAAYPAFVPVAGARWSSDRTSGLWAQQFALANGTPPSFAQIDAGPVVGDAIVPVAGFAAIPGRPQHYELGVWLLGGFVPVLTACYSPGIEGSGGSAGVAVASNPVVWAGTSAGTPSAGALSDCPG